MPPISNGGDRLTDSILQLAQQAERYPRLYAYSHAPASWAIAAREHVAILDACEAKDVQAVSASLTRHYLRAALTVLGHVVAEHDPVAVRTANTIVEGRD